MNISRRESVRHFTQSAGRVLVTRYLRLINGSIYEFSRYTTTKGRRFEVRAMPSGRVVHDIVR